MKTPTLPSAQPPPLGTSSSLRRLGLQPFCVTIDEKANDYLPHLFGTGGYVVVRRPSELPKRLPLLYARLTA